MLSTLVHNIGKPEMFLKFSEEKELDINIYSILQIQLAIKALNTRPVLQD